MIQLNKKGVIAIVILFILILAIPIAYYSSSENINIIVLEKEVKRSGGSDKYLIYTKDETFEITDDLLYGRFNSSDMWPQLKIGKTYIVKVVGYRIKQLSMYRNILEIKLRYPSG